MVEYTALRLSFKQDAKNGLFWGVLMGKYWAIFPITTHCVCVVDTQSVTQYVTGLNTLIACVELCTPCIQLYT